MPELTIQQKAVVENRGGALLVSAAAGSGKTFVLVRRLMSMICDETDPASVTDFLIITFTRAAASELRAKITEQLRDRLTEKPGNRHIQRQLSLVHGAKIMTIHAFCSSILRENAHMVDITPDFRQLEDSECRLLQAKALEELLESRYANMNEDFAALVENLSAAYNDERLAQVVLDAYEKVRTHADPAKWMEGQLSLLESSACGGEQNPWEEEILQDCRQSLDYWLARYGEAIHNMREDEAYPDAYLTAFEDDYLFMEDMRKAMDLGWDNVRELEAYAFPKLQAIRRAQNEENKQRLQNTRNGFKKEYKRLLSIFDVSRREILEDMAGQLPIARALFSLISDFDTYYARAKKRRNGLDFGDLEQLCVKLLTDAEGAPTEVAQGVSRRFREIMVDEFQDTNELQDLLINSISREGKNLFMVGDVKQSIYRFRLADPTIFLNKYRSFPDYDRAEEGCPRRIILSKNFRSRENVLAAVNDLFENIMSEGFGEMEYGENEKLYFGGDFNSADDPPVELSIIGMEDAEETEEEKSPDRRETEAEYVASRIASLIKHSTVTDQATGGKRPVEPKDIVILMRAPGARAQTYINMLNKAGIPAAFGSGAGGLLDTAEVRMLVSILEIIDNPCQDIPLIAAMKSPVFGFTPDQLAMIRAKSPKGSFYEAVEEMAKDDEKCRQFLQSLALLREAAGEKSSDELIWEVFATTDILPICQAQEDGELRRRNLLLLYQYACQYEQGGYNGLFSFLTRLRRLQEREEMLKGAGGASDGNVVNIMSIHQSKGLEYPIVFICDLAKQFNTADLRQPVLVHRQLGIGINIRDVDRMIEYPSVMRRACEIRMKRESLSEELRVLYVAMTRAKERLIMTASFKDADKVLEKCAQEAAAPVEPQLLLNAGSPARWMLYLLMSRPVGQRLLDSCIDKDCVEDFWHLNRVYSGEGLQRVYIEQQQTGEDKEYADLAHRFNQTYPHQGSLGLPAKVTATDLKGRFLDFESSDQGQPTTATHARSFARPAFVMEKKLTAAERGVATHLVMQYIDFAACTSLEETENQIAELGRSQIITPQQVQAVQPAKIYAFFESELGRRLLRSQNMLREFKFSVLAPGEMFFKGAGEDELMLQGVIDCSFEEDGRLVLLDFKTDNIAPGQEKERANSYKLQMELYSYALEKMTGKKVKERLLFFFKTGKQVAV